MLQWLKIKAKALKAQVLTLYFVSQDKRLPLPIKILAALIVAYALSPIDLIPDFIPVLGLLDDLILVPLGLWLVIKLTPPVILTDAQEKAKVTTTWPVNYVAGVFIIIVWLVGFTLCARWAWRYVGV